MASSSLPLYPTDDGWPYPDGPHLDGPGSERAGAPWATEPTADDDVDLDALELRLDPHAFGSLTELEYFAVNHRYGLECDPCSMKELARAMGCTHAEAAVVLGSAIDKLRTRLTQP